METIDRADKRIINVDEYRKIMDSETHHNHEIILDENGVIRWKPDEFIDFAFDNDILDLNTVIPLMCRRGNGKNSEMYRKLYRDLGYSLSGYWEVFYWNWNNENAHLYKTKQNGEKEEQNGNNNF
jgi:hypothetical protein